MQRPSRQLLRLYPPPQGLDKMCRTWLEIWRSLCTSAIWKTFLAQLFKPLKNISKYQHFLIDAGKPGWVFCKTRDKSTVETHCLLKSAGLLPSMSSQSCPARIKEPGLSIARQWYLY
ncbi:hypothetical protein DPMN_111733 [Dreissena polymorpha]|uniref:Uncharacterized protein n=1 Tax=Dreissena polymorpha TaxID=45954 RepID=A0A9D4KEE0_DREPO|nr:hypothetical protein DPMN_111733 [Dreissena polymorpha]